LRSRKEVEAMKHNVKDIMKQIQSLNQKIEYMEKEIYEIRKGNTRGSW
jgi:peptidoglycan hydrolase CwlO-like protein